MNVEKFIILQVRYYIYRAIVFNKKNSLYPRRREYISFLNCGQNMPVNCFIQVQAIIQSVKKLAKKIFFAFNAFFSICLIIRDIVCLIICSDKKFLGKKSFKKTNYLCKAKIAYVGV